MKGRVFVVLMLLSALFVVNVVAHVPITGGENINLESAIEVLEPTKSWAIYDEIHESGEAKYYRFHMESGERIRISLFTPDEGFTPGVVVMGGGLASEGTLPAGVEVPDGFGYMVFEGELSEGREYEPFTPTSYYFTADVDLNVTFSGDYYIAVFDESGHGKVGVAIGFVEKFEVMEWLLIPVDAINIHIWEGQSLAVILAPLYLTVVVGFLVVFSMMRKELGLTLKVHSVLVMFVGFLFIGSGLVIFMQMFIALSVSAVGVGALVTLVFGLLPIFFGYLLLRTSFKISEGLDRKNRVIIFVLGVLGLVLWSGIIIGPVLAVIASIMPSTLGKKL